MNRCSEPMAIDLEHCDLLAVPKHDKVTAHAHAPHSEGRRDRRTRLTPKVVQEHLCWCRLHCKERRLHCSVQLGFAEDDAGAFCPYVQEAFTGTPAQLVDGTLTNCHNRQDLPICLSLRRSGQSGAAPLNNTTAPCARGKNTLPRVEIDTRDLISRQRVPLIDALQAQNVALVICKVPEPHNAFMADCCQQALTGPYSLKLFRMWTTRELHLCFVDDFAFGVEGKLCKVYTFGDHNNDILLVIILQQCQRRANLVPL
mmetsp:Transcript_5610/g.9354  ORF Transcript_5610/g.9354 Transcript_5610/m.9354 type:complete len:257 (-) Transcript_5610:646-1416(-)